MAIRILGTGSFLPEKSVTNDELAQVMDTSDEWISSRTGIRSRHISVGDTTSSMAVKAAKKALEDGGVKPEELDHIFVATVSGDHATPSTSCEVQKALGAVNASCMDMNAACSGFIYALNTAMAYAKAGMGNKMLLIGVETLSKIVDWSDRSTCVLFGDGAGSVVVEADPSKEIYIDTGSDGARGDVLTCEERHLNNLLVKDESPMKQVEMDGQEVFKFAVRIIPKSVGKVLKAAGVDKSEIKYYILHQANYRIIEAAAKRLKEPLEKFPMNIDHCANTSSATIPILLDEIHRDGKLQHGDKIVMSGFGGGLTWGSVYLEW
ncbi:MULTISPECIES: beta-ketoacyl-ACP synthase III [Anaerostipes]|uniref:Beta-ketoacyl-[acyl-carrier-protein] synthase III n=1 Tax=Anaerostipes butyraticus TaxID=645466 RepID=A0A916Q5R4_9FIRM|nr:MULTISPECIES: beta-ketoacyl-ACP synthase III [Anaerostipes]GFO84904.1 3-oxoacyl-[acyl-carrier-protein] synthase 3 [Anaerostipes butyraticus]HJC82651.1 ketoacyl-ACP synthase III [Candidatus Anaerostipes avicola]